MEQTLVGALVVVIVAATQVIKNLRFVSTRYVPLIAILLGISGSFTLGGVEWLSVASGVIIGLSSVGLYSGFKATVLGK